MVRTDDDFVDATENNVEDSPDPNPDLIGLTGITGCLGISTRDTVEYASVVLSKINIIVITNILVIFLVYMLKGCVVFCY
jgi:hypothetical protein